MTKDAAGMHGIRSRNEDGQLRQKRSDTHVSTVEEMYGCEFGVRGDMHLGTLLQREGVQSLHELIENSKSRD